MMYQIPLLIGMLALSFGVIFVLGDLFPAEYSWMIWVIYTGLLLAMCFVPRMINQRLLRRWQNFMIETSPKVTEKIGEITDRIHNFIQFLIDDIREVLADNNQDFANYGLKLLSSDYENVKVLQELVQENVKFYESYGFKLLKKIIINELNLPLWIMVRNLN